jgi:Flp pilus assembly protein TadG
MNRMRDRSGQRGNAVIETALFMPLLILVFLGTADYGRVFNQAIIVANAAFAGAEFGSRTGQWSNTTGMATAATNDSGGLASFAATASNYCTCSPGGSHVLCTSTCTGYGTPIQYVQVTATATFKTIVNYPLLPHTVPLSVTSIIRVQ